MGTQRCRPPARAGLAPLARARLCRCGWCAVRHARVGGLLASSVSPGIRNRHRNGGKFRGNENKKSPSSDDGRPDSVVSDPCSVHLSAREGSVQAGNVVMRAKTPSSVLFRVFTHRRFLPTFDPTLLPAHACTCMRSYLGCRSPGPCRRRARCQGSSAGGEGAVETLAVVSPVPLGAVHARCVCTHQAGVDLLEHVEVVERVPRPRAARCRVVVVAACAAAVAVAAAGHSWVQRSSSESQVDGSPLPAPALACTCDCACMWIFWGRDPISQQQASGQQAPFLAFFLPSGSSSTWISPLSLLRAKR